MWLVLWLACAKSADLETVASENIIINETAQHFWSQQTEWSGEVQLPKSQVLGHTVHFAVVDGTLTATMDIPMQNAMGLPLSEIVATENTLRFVLKPPKAPKFAWAYYQFSKQESGEWVGTLTQVKKTFPATLNPGKANALERPQTPKSPFLYRVEEVTVPLAEEDASLAGTLTLPSADFGKPSDGWPAVVLITGSGPQDRDETIFAHKPFAVIADHLAKQGIASIRVDDRGVGGSTGARDDLTTVDFASDIQQVVAFIRTNPEIDPSRVGLVGHSEGGLIAAIVAAEDTVGFVVSLAGTGVNGLEVLITQNLDMLQVSDPEQRILFRTIYSQAIQSPIDSDDEREAVTQVVNFQAKYSKQELDTEMLNASLQQFQMIKQTPWFQTFLTLEPRTYWSKVQEPTLILNGDKDVQVAAIVNTQAISSALPTDTPSQVQILEGANHLFQQASTGQIAEYATISQTIDPEVLSLIAQWILGLERTE